MNLLPAPRRPLAMALMSVLCTSVFATAVGPAQAQTSSPRVASAPLPADLPSSRLADDSSVRESAAALVAESRPRADEDTRLRVVTVRTSGGVPEVAVERVQGESEAVAAVADAQEDDDVIAVSVDSRVHVDAALLEVSGADTYRSNQWALDRLGADRVWPKASGDGVVVAVVDTGVDGTHPDLAGRLTSVGVDYVTGSGPGHVDPSGHGTHVAGIVSAVQGNGRGIAGLAHSARVMSVRVLDGNGSGWTSNIAKGIIFAADNGARVINLSLGGPEADPAIQSAVDYASSRGAIVVAAAGNGRTTGNAVNYPAAFPGVIAVGSTELGDASSSFSNTGDYLDVAAPGGRILSTHPEGYAYMSGTSMATPYAAAVAALAMDATNGAVTPSRFEQVLTGTADDLGTSGWDREFGHGLVDPYATVCALVSCDGSTTEPAPEPGPESETEPEPEVTPAKRQLDLTFDNVGGDARPGRLKPVRLRVTDSRDGAAVGDQRVLVRGWRDGEIAVRRWVTTSSDGAAATSVRIRATTRFTLRSPGTSTTVAADSAGSVTWRAVPRVRERHRQSRATVRVLDDYGQRVKFQRARSGRWVTVRSRGLTSTGRATVRGLRKGTYRAQVTAVPGIETVRTAPWKVR